MLQYAHRQFAAASHAYSSTAQKPGERFERAVRTLLSMIFDPRSVAEKQARRVDRLHGSLNGVLGDGTPWSARDPSASAWVLTTLIDAVVFGADLALGRRPDHEVAQALGEARILGHHFHVREEDVPESRAALERRVLGAVERELSVGDEARAMWELLSSPRAPRRRDRARGWLTARFVAATLPPALRDPLGVSMSPTEERVLLATLAGAARAMTHLPDEQRFVRAYREARRARAAHSNSE